MSREEFEKLVEEGFLAIPEKFRDRVKNVAFLVEDEPSEKVRKEEGLLKNETLFGLYTGIPSTERGGFYGTGPTLPDTIIIYQKPMEEEAAKASGYGRSPDASSDAFRESVKKIVNDTVWHEVGHYLGLDEDGVERREKERGVR